MQKLMVETRTQKISWNEENEIVYTEIYAPVQTLQDAIENIDAQEQVRDQLKKEKTRVLVELGELVEISREAREYFANERTGSIQRATALLTGSKISAIIANFFMGLNKPKSPTKVFADKKSAIQWLKTFPAD